MMGQAEKKDTVRLFAVADIHGFYSKLTDALEEAEFFTYDGKKKFILCGDLLDRGTEATALIGFMLELKSAGELIYIKGNHEDLLVELLDALSAGETEDIASGISHHVLNGTWNTALVLAGMSEKDGLADPAELVRRVKNSEFYRELLPMCIDYYETEEHVFCHGWVPTKRVKTEDGEAHVYDPKWRTASERRWHAARWEYGVAMAIGHGVRIPGKTVVCGHVGVEYAHSYFKGSDGGEIYTPFKSHGIAAIDAHTAKSGRVNCVIFDDTELKSQGFFEDRLRGSLMGGAVGDALGYPVEFKTIAGIFRMYGSSGITELVMRESVGNRAFVSDDTQMTLYCADGIVRSLRQEKNPTLSSYIDNIHESFLSWLSTQDYGYTLPENITRSPLLGFKELCVPRAPGSTCLSALDSGSRGSVNAPINGSKGCGAVMRTAPIGFLRPLQPILSYGDIARLAAEAAALTHGHELGYLSASMLSVMIAAVLDGASLESSIITAKRELVSAFPECEQMPLLFDLIDKALALADEEGDDIENIADLGEGWVGEETLAISVYCAAKYINDFEKALIAAVNHSGDSDSTGAVTGNLLGAVLGYEKLPEAFKHGTDADEAVDFTVRALSSARQPH